MGVKMTGANFRAFIASDWGAPDAYWEDEVVLVDGEAVDASDYDYAEVPVEATVEIRGGTIYQAGDEPLDAEAFARRWVKQQSTVPVIVRVPKGTNLEALKSLVKSSYPAAEFD